MPHLNYDYKIKKENRNDYQAIFMLPAEDWKKFKKLCAENGKTPSKTLRDFIQLKICELVK